jgi:hypothetical protein
MKFPMMLVVAVVILGCKGGDVADVNQPQASLSRPDGTKSMQPPEDPSVRRARFRLEELLPADKREQMSREADVATTVTFYLHRSDDDEWNRRVDAYNAARDSVEPGHSIRMAQIEARLQGREGKVSLVRKP